MRILVIDNAAASLDWSLRCIADGHKVKWYVPPRSKHPTDFYSEVGKGLIERVADPREWYKWADLIFFTDNTKWIEYADVWRSQGWPVIAPNINTANWELDRDEGQKIFKAMGAPVIPGKAFNNYDVAMNYVKKEMARFVSKPSGDADKALSYVAKSPEDMIYMLERWKKNNKLNGDFILQKFVGGIEMAVGGWFGPGGFSRGWCENWEFKKLMNDDLGVATGEQGTVLRYVEKSKLADIVLKPAEKFLEKEKYVGYVDVNCIIDEEGTPWPLEWTMRPGWPLYNIQQAVHKGDHAEWLMDLATGVDSDIFKMDEIAVGVVLSIPDYPYSMITRKDVIGVPVYNYKTNEDLHPCEMMMGTAPVEQNGKIVSAPQMVTAGDYVLVATGTSSTISSARKKAYRTLDSLKVPNSPMWRTDIGKRLQKQLPDLNRMGYAKGLLYQKV